MRFQITAYLRLLYIHVFPIAAPSSWFAHVVRTTKNVFIHTTISEHRLSPCGEARGIQSDWNGLYIKVFQVTDWIRSSLRTGIHNESAISLRLRPVWTVCLWRTYVLYPKWYFVFSVILLLKMCLYVTLLLCIDMLEPFTMLNNNATVRRQHVLEHPFQKIPKCARS